MNNRYYLCLLLVIVLNLPIVLFAQQKTFSKVLLHNEAISATSIVPAYDKSYLIAGMISQINPSVIKADSLGDPVWCKSYRMPSSTGAFYNIVQGFNNNYWVAGSCLNPATLKNQALIVEMNPSGEVVRAKTIASEITDISAYSIAITADTGIVITGSTGEFWSNNMGIFAARLDKNNNLLWAKEYKINGLSNKPATIHQTADGGFLLAGNSQEVTSWQTQATFIKLDESGEILWARNYKRSMSNTNYGFDFINENDGYLCFISGGLMKTDFSGNVMWSKLFNDFGEYGNGKIKPLASGGLMLMHGADYFSMDNQLYSMALQLDAQLNLVRELSLNTIGVSDFAETPDKELLFVGNGPIFGVKSPSLYEPQVGLIQLDSLGGGNECGDVFMNATVADTVYSNSVEFNIQTIGLPEEVQLEVVDETLSLRSGCVDFFGNTNENQEELFARIFPNPASDVIHVEMTKKPKEAYLRIFNAHMQCLYQQPVDKSNFEVDVSSLTRGIYFVQLISGRQSNLMKIVKQ
jgi:hypothetical protein